MKRLMSVVSLALLLGLLVATGAVLAEERTGAMQDSSTSGVKASTPPRLKIAILPFVVEGAREGTKTVMPELYKSVFETAGFDVTMGVPVEQAEQKLNIRKEGVPTSKELLDIGQSLGVDYVLFASHKFKTKRVWVTLLPRARSELTLNPMIVNVKAKEIVYSPKDKVGYVRGGSNLQTGVGLVVYYPVGLFMGGNLGKVEKQTSENTIRSAYEDFFQSLIEKKTKIE